ncbi:helix-turn-helix domain-containing protein [Vibrio variabilis]|uniref:helix-turn-helix domain-containing protein n=1 Tax=Vibrio variabilis TaxID=990271 RepID=UPI0013A6A013|nr:AraC family transcriptional regulator [Vibrio variabilis]
MAISAQPVTDLFGFWLDKEPSEHQTWLVNIYRYVVDTMTTAHEEPSLTALAQRQNCSLATMKRRLAREGKNFTQIKDEIKMMICYHYLTMTSLPISMISEWTGFTSATNFSRACKRWFGLSPRAFRQQSSVN